PPPQEKQNGKCHLHVLLYVSDPSLIFWPPQVCGMCRMKETLVSFASPPLWAPGSDTPPTRQKKRFEERKFKTRPTVAAGGSLSTPPEPRRDFAQS
uniref:Uncharacterized protein n=1 Tax=Hippocampus comes TaxID=109280 RepID=A0A3Q2XT48_HIPCM